MHRSINCRFGKTGDPCRILAFHCNSRVSRVKVVFTLFLLPILAVAVPWSAIISYTPVGNFVRHFKRRDSETFFLEEY